MSSYCLRQSCSAAARLLITPTCLSHFKDDKDVGDSICCQGRCQEDGMVFSEAAKVMTLLSVEQIADGYMI